MIVSLFTFVELFSPIDKSIQKRHIDIDIDQYNKMLAYQYERFRRLQFSEKLRQAALIDSSTTLAPVPDTPYLHEALYSYRRFG